MKHLGGLGPRDASILPPGMGGGWRWICSFGSGFRNAKVRRRQIMVFSKRGHTITAAGDEFRSGGASELAASGGAVPLFS